MAKKIFVGNYKGGVGKTTTVFEIGAGLAKHYDQKVLLIDLDPQCSLTNICMQTAGLSVADIKPKETLNYAFDLYGENIKETSRLQILEGNIRNVYASIKNIVQNIPTHGKLSFIPTALDLKNSRINDLADRLSAHKNGIISIASLLSDVEKGNEFDYIIVDCPPSSNIIIQGIFLYCDYYLIPTIGDEISVNGVTDYITEIESTYSKVLSEDSVLSKFPVYQYPKMKNIFKNLIRHLDNRSTPGNYGIPITVSNGEIHAEYTGITGIINQIL